MISPALMLPVDYLDVQMLTLSVKTGCAYEARSIVLRVMDLARYGQLDTERFALMFECGRDFESRIVFHPFQHSNAAAYLCPPTQLSTPLQLFCIVALRKLSEQITSCTVASLDLASTGLAYKWRYDADGLTIWHGEHVTVLNMSEDDAGLANGEGPSPALISWLEAGTFWDGLLSSGLRRQ